MRILRFSLLALSSALIGAPFLVENGQPRAEIVIAETPRAPCGSRRRSCRTNIEKISGAQSADRHEAVGQGGEDLRRPQCAHGCAQGHRGGLEGRRVSHRLRRRLAGAHRRRHGFRAHSIPVREGNSDIPRAQAEWEKITSSQWGMPNAGLYKNRLTLPGDTGKPDGATTDEERDASKSGASMSAAASMRCAASCTSSARAGICRANWAKWCRR